MLHLTKLAVGCPDITTLRAFQERRAEADPPLRHLTRNTPRRAAEIVDKGSIYWVIGGVIAARQRVLEIRLERWSDGTACAGLVLDHTLVATQGRPTKAFRGWRYLPPNEAPIDLGTPEMPGGGHSLPESVLRELQRLCLL